MILPIIRPLAARTSYMRSIFITAKRMQSRSPAKLQELQKKFQANNKLPVFLKNGPRDKYLYQTTVGLALFGFLWSVSFLAYNYILD